MYEQGIDVASMKEGKISRIQVFVISLCVLLGMIDGYDNLAIAYAAPVMRSALNISPSVLGWVFSAALIGGIVGMLVGGPIADKYGRRPTLITQTFLFGAFTLLSAFARDSTELLCYRFFAGVGLGLALTVSYVVVVEYVPSRYRILCVTLIYAGYSTGAGLGGLLARSLLQSYSWHAIFFVGAAAAVLLALIFTATLPETLEFMVGANYPRERVDRLARRMRPSVFEAGEPTFFAVRAVERDGFRARELFSQKWLGKTLLLWLILFMNLFQLYSVQQWLPTLIHESGVDVGLSVSSGAVLQTGTILGALAYSQIIDRWDRPFRLFPWLFLAGGLSFVSLAWSGSSIVWMMASVFLLGMFVFGSQTVLNGVVTVIYPPAIRTTGICWAIAVGRIGGASGPVVTGLLLQSGVSPARVVILGAIPAGLALVSALCLSLEGSAVQDEVQAAAG